MWTSILYSAMADSKLFRPSCVHQAGPETSVPPEYSHCSMLQMERFANKYGVTYHCAHCRSCRTCKGKLIRIAHPSGEITYFPLKDCRNTCLPAPRGCGEGDLVRDAGANEYIVDGLGPGGVEQRVPYPLDVRKVTFTPPEPSSSRAPSSTASTPQRIQKKPIRAVITTHPDPGVSSGSSQVMVAAKVPIVDRAQDTSNAVTREDVISIVREAMQLPTTGPMPASAGAMPASAMPPLPQSPDVHMEMSVREKIRTLENQASQLLTEAAYLRKNLNMPLPSLGDLLHAETVNAFQPVRRSEAVTVHDPDLADSWERVLLH